MRKRNLSFQRVVDRLSKPIKMVNTRPLIFVDDDAEDQELMMQSLRELGIDQSVKLFQSAESALDYLNETTDHPFIIVSDINMPRMDGIAFKKSIDNSSTLRAKCIPFVFLSTSNSGLKDTCDLNIQGYFEKGNSLEYLNETMKVIFKYWVRTKHMSPLISA